MAYSTLQNLHSGIQNVLGGQGLYFGWAAFIDVKMMLIERLCLIMMLIYWENKLKDII